MSATKLVSATIAATLLLGGAFTASASANPARATSCVFDKHEPVHVVPFTVDSGMDWGSYSYMGGAQLFVPAREGLTKEWLAAAVQHAVASAHVVSAGDTKAVCDLPKVKDVHVGVVSGGNGFWVQLIGRDGRTSDALLKWAREFVELRNKSGARASR